MPPFVVGSAGVHLVILMLIAVFPSLGKSSKPPGDFIVVTVTAGLPGQPVPPAPAAQPAPTPQQPPEGVRLETKVPTPKPPKKKPG